MGNEVYANGREVSCKAANGKSVAAFPDVCMTPPQTPATPPGVPIPYPNTGMASDMTDGSKNVKVSGKEVMLKDKSYFKKSMGDEAGCAPMKGVVTHKNMGKVYFKSWSMDVKFEGENVVRHLDMTTHNHASETGQTPPWPHLDKAELEPGGACYKENKKIMKKCLPEKDWRKNCPVKPTYPATNEETAAYAKSVQRNACLNARRCMLVPYKPDSGCCDGQTGHHVIDNACFKNPVTGLKREHYPNIEGWGKYETNAAPCVCAEGYSWHKGTHSEMHVRTGVVAAHLGRETGRWTRQQATRAGARAVKKTFPSSGCSQACIEAQLNNYHDQAKTSDPEEPILAESSMEADPLYRAMAAADMGVPPPANLNF